MTTIDPIDIAQLSSLSGSRCAQFVIAINESGYTASEKLIDDWLEEDIIYFHLYNEPEKSELYKKNFKRVFSTIIRNYHIVLSWSTGL